MRVVIAADKFKGSLTAAEVGGHLSIGLASVLPDCEIAAVPMADGGEGTLEVAADAGYALHEAVVTGPLGDPVAAHFAVRGDEAVVELARASGLGLISPDHRDALRATSRGTGELILAALDAGAKVVMLAVGGSASTDGGAGMLRALGARLLDEGGAEVPDGGGGLLRVASVDLAGLDPRIAETRIVLASDVDNPLLGPRGAVAVFAPQKGARRAECARLELGMTVYARALLRAIDGDADLASQPGAGAAGGVGFAALAALGADRWPGVEVVAAIARLRAHLAGCDLVITGRGASTARRSGARPRWASLASRRRSACRWWRFVVVPSWATMSCGAPGSRHVTPRSIPRSARRRACETLAICSRASAPTSPGITCLLPLPTKGW